MTEIGKQLKLNFHPKNVFYRIIFYLYFEWKCFGQTSKSLSPNVSTSPVMAMGCRQCLPLSVVQLKGKHCRRPHCRNGVVDTFGHYICSYCNAHFSHHHKQKNVRHYHSKMSTSSEMKKSTKDIRHLETTINQSTVEKFWTRTGWNCQKIFRRLTLRLQYKLHSLFPF